MKKLKQVGKNWSIVGTVETKIVALTPSIATIHKGNIWPIGISLKWLYFGVSFVYVG